MMGPSEGRRITSRGKNGENEATGKVMPII